MYQLHFYKQFKICLKQFLKFIKDLVVMYEFNVSTLMLCAVLVGELNVPNFHMLDPVDCVRLQHANTAQLYSRDCCGGGRVE